MDKAKQILKKYFGYDDFRPLQEEIIKSVLEKQDSLVIMPTGGGKSLCYQIPALLFEGLTVVISPLISLMKDQVGQLRENGVPTAILNSSLTKSEYAENLSMVSSGKAKLLYIAPESLNKMDIILLLKQNKVDCLTVDEAHCISEWGHDFRPDYRQLGLLRKKLTDTVCIGLTATATPRVQDDIITNLNLVNGKKFLAGFNRENLFLNVIPKSEPLEQTISFLRERPGHPGIIYCFSRKQVEELTGSLSYYGFSVKPYHAGLSDEERHKNQDLFSRDAVQIIVATIAFGMGINKSNVRFVIHYDLPKNIESYYQEIGRAGRDGLKADCLLLYTYSDVNKLNYFIDQKTNERERENAVKHLQEMVRYSEWHYCRRIPLLNYFGEKYESHFCGACDNCLADKGEQADVTIAAQKFLSAIKRTGEFFGINYIAEVLTGANTSKIIGNGHEKLSVYGIGKEFSRGEWQLLGQQLINQGLALRDVTYGGLSLTEKSKSVLFNGVKVSAYLTKRKAVSKAAVLKPAEERLIALLKEKRKEIAEKENVPPFVVFSDNTLQQMSLKQPVNLTTMAEISGVGSYKLKKYGEAFIRVIRNFIKGEKDDADGNNPKEIKIKHDSRSVMVGEKFNEGNSIEELTSSFYIKKDTVLNHLYKYILSGKQLDISKLDASVNIKDELRERVFDFFRQSGVFRLNPAFEHFEKKINYDDLKMLRLLFLSENPEQIVPLSRQIGENSI